MNLFGYAKIPYRVNGRDPSQPKALPPSVRNSETMFKVPLACSFSAAGALCKAGTPLLFSSSSLCVCFVL